MSVYLIQEVGFLCCIKHVCTMFSRCITGLLGRSTRILVTHQLQFLPSADKVVVVKNGRIVEMGTYIELKNKGVEFSEFKLRMEKEGRTQALS